MPPRGRAGFFCQSGALGSAILEKVAQPRPRPLDVRQRRQPRRRLRQRPPAVLGGGRRPPRSCCSTSSRSATRASSPGSPAGSRGASRSSRSGPVAPPRACRWATRSAQIAAPHAGGRRDVPAGRGDPGRHPRRDVRRRPAARPPAAAARAAGSPIVGNSDALGLLAADAAAAVGLVVNRSVALGADATRRGLRGRPRRRHRRPRRRRGGRGLHPAAQRRRARRSPTCSPRWGSSPTSRWSRRSSAPRACPSCCGSPTSPARPPAAARCRRTPRSRPRSARWPGSWSTPCGCAPPTARRRDPDDRRRRRAPGGWSNGLLARAPRGRDLDDDELTAAARRPTASSCGSRVRSPPLRRGGRGRRASSAGTSCSRRPPSTCASGPTWPTSGATSTTPRRCATPGTSLDELDRRARATAGFVVQKNAPPGRPGRDPQPRGPAVRAGRLLRHRRAADRAARRQVLPDPAAHRARRRGDGARDQGLADAVRLPRQRGRSTSTEVERLIQRVAQLQNDLPQVRALELSLVLAGADGATVLTAAARVEPGRRPALGLVRAPAHPAAGGHAA